MATRSGTYQPTSAISGAPGATPAATEAAPDTGRSKASHPTCGVSKAKNTGLSAGQLKVVNLRFIDNRSHRFGPDLGGAATRALAQFRNRPVYIKLVPRRIRDNCRLSWLTISSHEYLLLCL
jgi:hypothetical protein